MKKKLEMVQEQVRGRDPETPAKKHPTRGFASMTQEQRSAIARKGGVAAHKQGVAHEWNKKTAALAGSLGGSISRGGRGRLVKAE